MYKRMGLNFRVVLALGLGCGYLLAPDAKHIDQRFFFDDVAKLIATLEDNVLLQASCRSLTQFYTSAKLLDLFCDARKQDERRLLMQHLQQYLLPAINHSAIAYSAFKALSVNKLQFSDQKINLRRYALEQMLIALTSTSNHIIKILDVCLSCNFFDVKNAQLFACGISVAIVDIACSYKKSFKLIASIKQFAQMLSFPPQSFPICRCLCHQEESCSDFGSSDCSQSDTQRSENDLLTKEALIALQKQINPQPRVTKLEFIKNWMQEIAA